MNRSVKERLLRRVVVDERTGCWLWQGGLDKYGYAQMTLNGKSRRAHRVAYEEFVGPIPDGLEIDHVRARGCEHRRCIYFGHLEPVTGRENKLRGDTVNAKNLAKTACAHGHEFDEQNTYVDPRGQRHCRACRRRGSQKETKMRATILGFILAALCATAALAHPDTDATKRPCHDERTPCAIQGE